MGSKLSYDIRHLMWDVNRGSWPPSLLLYRFPHQPRLIGVPLFSFYLWCATVRIRVLREKVRLLAVGGVEWKARRIARIWLFWVSSLACSALSSLAAIGPMGTALGWRWNIWTMVEQRPNQHLEKAAPETR